MDIFFKSYWSNDIPEGVIDEIIALENVGLYYGNFTRELFQKKYVQNIYGPSLHILVYADGKPVGIHNAWRNDIGHMKAYEGTDAFVMPVEGVIIFPKMLRMVEQIVGPDSSVYGFPNHNSLPVELMMRHKLVATCRQTWLFSATQYSKDEPIIIPDSYVRWWLVESRNSILSIQWRKHFYLVRIIKRRWMITIMDIIGEVSEEAARIFPCFGGHLFLLSYKSRRPRWYNKNRFSGFHIINYGVPIPHIPTWTVDSI